MTEKVAAPLEFDVERSIGWLMEVLAVEGTTGQEKAISEKIIEILTSVGVPESDISYDKANEKIPLPTETGNLIVRLKGSRRNARRLFMTHMDTVPLCAGAVPVRKGNKIVPEGVTALGGDNRTGVACLINTIATLIDNDLPCGPMTFLFTVREESGLWGAHYVDPKVFDKIEMCFNVDGRDPAKLTIGAVGADRWNVEITGKASHAGVHPEQGISATLVAALALAEVKENGWFGLVEKDDKVGTSNVGSFGDADGQSAGNATNVVTDYVHIKGESRSRASGFIGEITKAYKAAFQNAAKQVTDDQGKTAKVKFSSSRDYHPFEMKEDSPVVRFAVTAAEAMGLEPELVLASGGLDANWMVKHGVPTVTFGAGQNEIHTVKEFVDLKEFEAGCRFALQLATFPDLEKPKAKKKTAKAKA
ncbi:MAG: M20/M25/M40 family metallo-hydrolase [Gemmataceae bacterium]